VKEKVKIAAFRYLIGENNSKEKTNDVVFEKLEMSEYLVRNKGTSLSKIIFSVRSKTLDIKEWLPWDYIDNKCVACKKTFETMDHFMTCTSYKNNPYGNWREINGNNVKNIEIIGIAVEKR
jgi:hypothetical protein